MCTEEREWAQVVRRINEQCEPIHLEWRGSYRYNKLMKMKMKTRTNNNQSFGYLGVKVSVKIRWINVKR